MPKRPFNVRLSTKDRRRAMKAAKLETRRVGEPVSASELIRRGGLPLVKRVLVKAGVETGE